MSCFRPADIYVSVSKQYRDSWKKVICQNALNNCIKEIGINNYNIRCFDQGTSYTSTEDIMGDPDLHIILRGTEGIDRIGKGAYTEAGYSFKHGIPVLVFDLDDRDLYMFDHFINFDHDDWSSYAGMRLDFAKEGTEAEYIRRWLTTHGKFNNSLLSNKDVLHERPTFIASDIKNNWWL